MKDTVKTAREIIEHYDGPPVRIMEVCGTHTHEIFRLGIRKLLPEQVNLISGPGCPVCVTPADFIDEAIWLALEKNVTICTFGDLVRVPGSKKAWRRPEPRVEKYRWCTRRQTLSSTQKNTGTSRWYSCPWDLRPPRRPPACL